MKALRDKPKLTLFLVLPLLCLFCLAGCQAQAYESADWAKEELTQAEKNELIPESLLSADMTRPISRQEYAAAAVALYEAISGETAVLPLWGETPPEGAYFLDCEDESVLLAQHLSIVEGMGDGRFCPDDPLSREQAAVMLLRVCRAAAYRVTAEGSGPAFRDQNEISTWALDAVKLLSGAGVIHGVGDGRFAPKAPVSRQEALLLNQRILSQSPAGGNFSAQLISALAAEENILISPVSAQLALGLLQAGAGSSTKAQLDTVLGSIDFSAWQKALQTQSPGPTVEVANSVWFDDSVTVEQSYLDKVERDFNAESRTLKLSSASALQKINSWVKEKTHGLIPRLLEEKLPEESAAVLINALYFNGEWQYPFDHTDSYPQTFHSASGAEAEISFMHDCRHNVYYLESDSFRAAALPYKGEGDWWMLLLLPKEGYTPADLAQEDLATVLNKMEERYVRLSLPRFTLEGSYDLTGPLMQMGITDAFLVDRADFIPMGSCSKGPLFVDQVLQKTYLRVDEKGTEAAAVTGIVLLAGSAMETEQPIDLCFDRPFLCCLWNGQIQQPVFLATVDSLQ